MSGKKFEEKLYRRHETGARVPMKTETFRALQGRIPERIIEKAVRGMLPKNRMGREFSPSSRCTPGRSTRMPRRTPWTSPRRSRSAATLYHAASKRARHARVRS